MPIPLISVVVAALVFTGCSVGESQHSETSYSEAYGEVMASIVPHDDAADVYQDISNIAWGGVSQSPSCQEIAHLVSVAVSHRGEPVSGKNEVIVREGVRFLLETGRAGEDGLPRWGLFFEWDAFSDGSVNPANTSYGITVANVVCSLLDAYGSGCLDDATNRAIESALHNVTVYWCQSCFSETDAGGYFWYSDQASDDVDCPNVSAALSGAFARTVAQLPSVFDDGERAFAEERVESALDQLSAGAVLVDGMPFWPYSERGDSLNDLVHQVFTLDGIDLARQYGFGFDCSWERTDERNSVRAFLDGPTVWNSAEMGGAGKPASIYDAGAALSYFAGQRDADAADVVFAFAQREYAFILNGDIDDAREASFMLKGLSDCALEL